MQHCQGGLKLGAAAGMEESIAIVCAKVHKRNRISRFSGFLYQPSSFIYTTATNLPVIMRLPTSIVLALATLAAAHPGEDHHDELQQRRSFEAGAERLSLRHCAEQLKARGITDRNIKRRTALIQEHRQKREN